MKLPYTLDDELMIMLQTPKPQYLYKYHPMNLHLMEMLTNAEFYMSKKSDLNDPLDMAYPISLENYLNLYFEKYPSEMNYFNGQQKNRSDRVNVQIKDTLTRSLA